MIFEDDLHARRVQSLANGVVGVLDAAVLSVHAIGRGYAHVIGGNEKHGVKQTDRLLSNRGLDVWLLFSPWVKFVVGERKEIVIALDWTEFDADDHATLAGYLITSHGRATPVIWMTVRKSTLEGKRNDHEYRVVERLHECLGADVAVTRSSARSSVSFEGMAQGAVNWRTPGLFRALRAAVQGAVGNHRPDTPCLREVVAWAGMTDRRQTQRIDKGHEDPVAEYSESFRNRMVEKMTGPRAKSATTLATEVGVPQPTLSRWKREAGTVQRTMSPPDDGKPAPSPTKRPQDWTAEEKWALVTEAATVPDAELERSCVARVFTRRNSPSGRRRRWQRCSRRVGASARRRTSEAEDPEPGAGAQAEGEGAGRGGGAAGAEKKLQAIWGDEDDDTTPSSDE